MEVKGFLYDALSPLPSTASAAASPSGHPPLRAAGRFRASRRVSQQNLPVRGPAPLSDGCCT
ncbi:hypothetical protein RHGRI_004854 [Rhododendron griersonianum]|uniref:Uncharacterized protein n=1 Tax=Rhododendron griersonianum TaxID=479676 RepID=A0AAV6LDE0_9ERIC|nr:hypothetical protein RHGRI_004854 [Rhododendron griersonianum]